MQTRTRFAVLAMMWCGSAIIGCASREPAVPRDRMGCLPFPGMFTLYATADPSQLGEHRYERIPRIFETDEKERGIVYTARAGFLDLAHLRESIDWTRYDTLRMRSAISAGRKCFTIAGKDNSRLHITLNYPPEWKKMRPAERDKITESLAARCGQHLAFMTMTWHEIITWFGHSTVAFVDESPSSFTWDDTMSHMVGIRIGSRALRDKSQTFNDAATAALSAELKALGAVKPEKTTALTHAVEGLWWADGHPLKRQFATETANPVVEPWLVPGFKSASTSPAPMALALPSFANVKGHDFSGFMSIQIEPRIFESGRICRTLPNAPKRISDRDDLPKLVAVVREQMQAEFGENVCDPSSPDRMNEATARAVDAKHPIKPKPDGS